MKCPKCKHNQRLGREGMRCKCGYAFVFNPKGDERMTDARFMAAVTKASGGGLQHFTLNQLHGAIARLEAKKTKTQTGCLAFFAVGLLVAACFVVFHEKFPAIAMTVIAAFVALAAISSYFSGPRPLARVRALADKWRIAGNDLERFIDVPSLGSPPPEWAEHDIYDYGVERILIVQRDTLVDLFVLNGFHSQERALIVSESGYPHYLMPHFERLLGERPTLPVFLLHDSTEEGVAMRSRLLLKPYGDRLKPPRPIVDLGLHPKDVARMKAFRFFKPKRAGYRVPADILPYAFLAGGISASMSRNAALGALPFAPRSASDEGGGGDFAIIGEFDPGDADGGDIGGGDFDGGIDDAVGDFG